MKYFLDTEFIEGTQIKSYLGGFITIGQHKPTIDLISIGIVSEDGREYYAISKDFNLKEAWNRWQIDTENLERANRLGLVPIKTYWIRENVLKPIWFDLITKDVNTYKRMWRSVPSYTGTYKPKHHIFTYKNFKRLLNKYGKSNKIIAEEIKDFTLLRSTDIPGTKIDENLQFYTYYGAYDWVVFCWLFGKMIDLPRGFPMFSRDLKVMLDDKVLTTSIFIGLKDFKNTFENRLRHIKAMDSYPTQDNCHNALDDAKWNKNLYNFLKTL